MFQTHESEAAEKGSRLNIGRIPFLVCAPFFHSTLDGVEGLAFSDGAPRLQNLALRDKRIDCAPSSCIEYGLHFRDYKLYPAISTSSRLEMKSVLFLSHIPWEGLDGVPVGLSADSDTSNLLFRILCARRFKVMPAIAAEEEAVPGGVAAGALGASPLGRLFIGDKALLESLSGQWPYRYDLADMWAKWQGLPFSFGLWIVRRDALEAKRDLVFKFHRILLDSLSSFRADPGRALDAWTRVYRSNLPRSLMLDFYSTADYGFSPEHARSLSLFYRLAHEDGHIPEIPEIVYAT